MGQNPLLEEPNWQRISATLLQKMPRGIGLLRSSIIRACRLSPVSFVEHQFSTPPIAMERRRFAYDGWGNVQSLGGTATIISESVAKWQRHSCRDTNHIGSMT